MKPITSIACLFLATLSLSAAEPQSQAKDDAKTQASAHPSTVLSATETVSADDSPLVRAAKAARRPGKKSSTVITNETLVRTGGHFTTTDTQQPLAAVRRSDGPSEAQMIADGRRKAIEATAAAARNKKADEQKKLATARSAQLMEGDTPEAILNDPPPSDGTIQPLKPTSPSTMEQPQPKPPL
jgi:hypothetical protein